MKKHKVVVVGAGAWGGWSAYMLQKAGFEVTLVDKRGPGNAYAGSGGQTRVIRLAYGGNPVYTQLTARSFDLWQHYEREWQEQFYHETGSLWLFRGVPADYAARSQPLMQSMGHALDELSEVEARQRFPQVNFENITSTWFEPRVGYLRANYACAVVKSQFEALGGTYLQGEVVSLQGEGRLTSVKLAEGTELKADHFVFACGPWMKNLFPFLDELIEVSRQEVYFFEAPSGHLKPDLPIWIEFRGGEEMYYGIPGDAGTGFKVAYDQREWPLDPDLDDREVTPAILAQMREVVSERFPAVAGAKLLKHHTCVYESSADGEFIIDHLPQYANALMLCGSSGHGFKMGPAIGELIANYHTTEQALPAPFSWARFASGVEKKTQYEV